MSFWDAAQSLLHLDDAALRFGRRVQRIVAFSLAGITAAASFSVGPNLLIFAAWFFLAGCLPGVFGRLIATSIAVLCGMAILIGDGGGGVTFRLLVAIAAAPFLLLAGVLWSREFAAVFGRFAVESVRAVFAPRV